MFSWKENGIIFTKEEKFSDAHLFYFLSMVLRELRNSLICLDIAKDTRLLQTNFRPDHNKVVALG